MGHDIVKVESIALLQMIYKSASGWEGASDPRGPGRASILIEGDVPSPIEPTSGCSFHPRCSIAEDICKEVAPKLINIDGITGQRAACHLVPGMEAGAELRMSISSSLVQVIFNIHMFITYMSLVASLVIVCVLVYLSLLLSCVICMLRRFV